MNPPRSTARHPLPWTLAGVLAGAGTVLAAHYVRTDDHAVVAPASGVHGEAAPGRFVAPLGRQADTGELSIATPPVPYRTDTFRIPLASGDEAGHEIEQKLRAANGAALAYTWSVEGIANPEEFYADLHGHAPPVPGYREASYRQGGGLQDSGSFTAPFDGIHGWLFKNDSAGPATVILQVAGFYEPVTAAELAQIERQIETLVTP